MKNNRLMQVALAASLTLVGTTAFAQGPGGPGGRGGRMDPAQMVERQVTDMKDRLKLTDEQAAKVKPIIEAQMKQMAELREKYPRPEPGNPPSEEMMTAMQKMREETNTKIAAVLTPEQQTEFKKFSSERRGMGPGGPGGRRPPQQ
ncbi:MAG: Spy/CpxP family protein refolding chaperone [Acidobacteria bacterium]|nr:Spy/CpxP family protein refolding chaperone [Acidobacteriota bacterium]